MEIKNRSFLPVILILLSIIIVWSLSHCSTKGYRSSNKKVFTFIDSTEASVKIKEEDAEGFFGRLSSIDMSIQMKSDSKLAKHEQLELFKSFLGSEVSSWSHEEKKLMISCVESALTKIRQINPKCIPEFGLIKIKTNHYGKDVYYTRGANIFIPENIFRDFEEEKQIPIIIHEIFHLISRKNQHYREAMYSLIGFRPLAQNPEFPSSLQNVLLTNPDGLTYHYVLNTSEPDQKETLAIPLITSNETEFVKDKEGFFDYLQFDLYEVVQEGGQWKIKDNGKGKTTLPLHKTPRFFTQIKDNTQYIIHPEEIMADNFMLAVLAQDKKDYSRFSPDGKRLIEQVTDLTKTYSFQ